QQLTRQRRTTTPKRQLAVMIANRRARSAAAAVRQQRHISARGQFVRSSPFRRSPRTNRPMRREQTKLHKMISAAARAELRPCLVLVLLRHATHGPIRIHHLMLAAMLEIRAHAKTGLRFDRARE